MMRAIFTVLAFIVVVVIILIILFIGGGFYSDYIRSDDKTALENHLQDRNEQIAKLESENENYRIENNELNAEIARLNTSQPGGEAVQEKRKALAEKDARLKIKESQLSRREERIRLAEEKIEKQQQEFYEKTGLTMKEIGAAEQIKKDYENMRTSRDRAEDRANNWLIYFSIVLFMFVASVIFLMYMVAKDRRVGNAIRIIDSVHLSTRDKSLLVASLGGRLIEHRGEKDDDVNNKRNENDA